MPTEDGCLADHTASRATRPRRSRHLAVGDSHPRHGYDSDSDSDHSDSNSFFGDLLRRPRRAGGHPNPCYLSCLSNLVFCRRRGPLEGKRNPSFALALGDRRDLCPCFDLSDARRCDGEQVRAAAAAAAAAQTTTEEPHRPPCAILHHEDL